MVSFGFSKMIQPFSSEGDMIAWLKKADLVANLEGIPYVVSLIPLFLEGDALALYLVLSDEDKKDTEMIRIWLIRVSMLKKKVDIYEEKLQETEKVAFKEEIER